MYAQVFVTLCEMAGHARFTTGAANVDECYLKVWAVLLDLVHEHLPTTTAEHQGLQLLDGDDAQRTVAAGFTAARLLGTRQRILATARAPTAQRHLSQLAPPSAGAHAGGVLAVARASLPPASPAAPLVVVRAVPPASPLAALPIASLPAPPFAPPPSPPASVPASLPAVSQGPAPATAATVETPDATRAASAIAAADAGASDVTSAIMAVNAAAAAAAAADVAAAKNDDTFSDRDEFLDEVEDDSEIEDDDYEEEA